MTPQRHSVDNIFFTTPNNTIVINYINKHTTYNKNPSEHFRETPNIHIRLPHAPYLELQTGQVPYHLGHTQAANPCRNHYAHTQKMWWYWYWSSKIDGHPSFHWQAVPHLQFRRIDTVYRLFEFILLICCCIMLEVRLKLIICIERRRKKCA